MAKAKIIEIKAAGAVVLLDNNEKAWLPGQELSTKYIPSKKMAEQGLCKINDEIDVTVYDQELGGKRKLVSHIRFGHDPWHKVNEWPTGTTKAMEIFSVTPNRVYGRIESGIRGFIDIDDLYQRISFPRSWKEFKTPSAGDTIAGLVKVDEIDHNNRLIKLDPVDIIKNQQYISPFLPTQDTTSPGGSETDYISPELPGQTPGSGGFASFPGGIQHILVVDDDPKFLKEICTYIESQGIAVTCATSKNEANRILDDPECPDFNIAILDVNLAERYDYIGFQVAKAIARVQPRCPIIMTTGEYFDSGKIFKVAGNLLYSGFLYKPFGSEELGSAVANAMAGKQKTLEELLNVRESRQVSESVNHEPAPGLSLHTVIKALKEEIEAEITVLFRIHPLSHEVRIAAYCGILENKAEEYLDKFRYSPVRDAAVDKETQFAAKVRNTPLFSKHRWLVRALSYESCVGVPVPAAGEWEYCLFAFHGNEDFFNDLDVYKVTNTADKIALLLESQKLEETIRSENPFYVAGKTYGSMAHDLVNALNREFGLTPIFQLIEGKTNLPAEDLEKIKKHLLDLQLELKRARGIVQTFRRMSRSQHEQETLVDVFETVKQAAETIASEAKAMQTAVHVRPPEGDAVNRCLVRIRRTALEQVLYNLFLNAAQQIQRFSFARERGDILVEFALAKAVEKGKNGVEVSPGKSPAATATTGASDSVEMTPAGAEPDQLQVLIHDTGPGIHTRDFEQIFQKGYTTKEDGCGMGLDICRNIINRAGGSIRVLKSILFCGTTFEIRLPLVREI